MDSLARLAESKSRGVEHASDVSYTVSSNTPSVPSQQNYSQRYQQYQTPQDCEVLVQAPTRNAYDGSVINANYVSKKKDEELLNKYKQRNTVMTCILYFIVSTLNYYYNRSVQKQEAKMGSTRFTRLNISSESLFTNCRFITAAIMKDNYNFLEIGTETFKGRLDLFKILGDHTNKSPPRTTNISLLVNYLFLNNLTGCVRKFVDLILKCSKRTVLPNCVTLMLEMLNSDMIIKDKNRAVLSFSMRNMPTEVKWRESAIKSKDLEDLPGIATEVIREHDDSVRDNTLKLSGLSVRAEGAPTFNERDAQSVPVNQVADVSTGAEDDPEYAFSDLYEMPSKESYSTRNPNAYLPDGTFAGATFYAPDGVVMTAPVPAYDGQDGSVWEW